MQYNLTNIGEVDMLHNYAAYQPHEYSWGHILHNYAVYDLRGYWWGLHKFCCIICTNIRHGYWYMIMLHNLCKPTRILVRLICYIIMFSISTRILVRLICCIITRVYEPHEYSWGIHIPHNYAAYQPHGNSCRFTQIMLYNECVIFVTVYMVLMHAYQYQYPCKPTRIYAAYHMLHIFV